MKKNETQPIEANRIILGDCIAEMQKLPAHCIDLIFADPPYFLQLADDLWRPNNTQVDAVTDKWDHFESFVAYDAFTAAWLTEARRILKPSGAIWVMGSYHNVFRVGTILQNLNFWILNSVEWIKTNPLPNMKGTRFCNAHETLIWALPAQGGKYTFHYKELKAANEDKQMRSDWYLPICSGGERLLDENGDKAHSTQKPEALLRRVILATTNPGDIVLDPFFGTGTTGAVAKKLNRKYIGIDSHAPYVKVATERIAAIEGTIDGLSALKADMVGAPKKRVPFLNIVEGGLLAVGQQLRLYSSPSKATDFYAVVHEDGTLESQGVRGSIHHVGKELLGLPSCNGWSHWYTLHDTDKGEHSIDILRSLYLAQEAEALAQQAALLHAQAEGEACVSPSLQDNADGGGND